MNNDQRFRFTFGISRMHLLFLLLFVLLALATSWRMNINYSSKLRRAFSSSFAVATVALNSLVLQPVVVTNVLADDSTSTIASSKDITFLEFLEKLSKSEVTKVIFIGVNPKEAIVTLNDGTIKILSELPAEDPKSPSGVAQVIAKCQHTPGVICQQDISDALV